MELPEEDELVLTVIRKIMPYGAFCTLPEYKDTEAFLHVSEVAPRWIKNIHEFISEGQRHVAKVYRINHEKNQIDISLKRVSEEEKKQKLLLVRQEKRTEKWIGLVLAQSKEKMAPAELRTKLEAEFGDAFEAFGQAAERDDALEKIDLPDIIREQIYIIARKSIKKPIVKVQRRFVLTCYSEDGVTRIRDMLTRKEPNVQVHYLGAPRYQIEMTASSYKEGEKGIDRLLEDIKSMAGKNKCEMSVEKE